MKKVLIEWSDKFSVGFERIDSQHKKLIGMINDLYFAFAEGKADDMLELVIDRMIEYTEYHFKIEEDLFEKYNYSETSNHIEQHEFFVAKVHDFYDSFKKGDAILPFKIMSFLKDWLINHIEVSDKKYAVEFLKKGIKFNH